MRRARNLIWLTPESLQAAERLSWLTGMPVADLIELVLLELTEHEMVEAPPRRPSRPTDAPATRANVVPIERARAARRRAAEAAAPDSGMEDLHSRCLEVRANARRARAASVQARERARAVREGLDGKDAGGED